MLGLRRWQRVGTTRSTFAELSHARIMLNSMDQTEAEKNIARLREEIRKHDRLYYQDTAPVIQRPRVRPSLQELVDLETQFPDLLHARIRQHNASAENRCRRLRKSSTARRCLASTTPIPKKSGEFLQTDHALVAGRKNPRRH
jgi:hypothetical protein